MPLLFVGQQGFAKTFVLDNRNRQVAAFKGSGRIAVDRNGAVYVAATAGGYPTKSVRIFTPPYVQQTGQINFGSYFASAVAVDERNDLLAITANATGKGSSRSFVRFYSSGTTSCNTLSFPGSVGQLGTGSTFDANGTLFSTVLLSTGGTAIASTQGECGAKSFTVNTLPSPQIYPGNPLAFNSHNQLVFEDRYTGDILTFAHPNKGRFGPPLAVTRLKGYVQGLQQFACLASDGKHLWASVYRYGVISEFAYPAGGEPIVTLSVFDPDSCAVSPPIVPQ